MNERAARPTPDIVARQRQAADPDASVWVEANAGSGKTHVLTERVLRILLTGVPPENLLCLTYTKAAAAEMRRRVSERLGHWAIAEEAELIAGLTAFEQRPPGEAMLHRARTLFGHALETPGGLKINTIHAFCESVLHRFPLEARVPFGFSVIEDAEQAELIRHARERVLAEGVAGKGERSVAVATLFSLMSDSQIEDAIAAALARASDLRAVLAGRRKAGINLGKLVGIKPDETIERLSREVLGASLFPPERYTEVFAVSPPDPEKSRFEDRLALIDRDAPDPDTVLRTFLTAEGEVPKRFPKKDFLDAPGTLGADLLAEAERLAALAARLKAARLVARSEALLDVLAEISETCEAEKRARSRLDFDDLIAKTAALLAAEDEAWVRYRLDAGITHILVDESQDTNSEQWKVVRALADEFFAGEGAVRGPRTLFAVGDKKQSIYSFQGAEPRLFGETGRELEKRAGQVQQKWHRVPLRASFRTLPGILDAVDRICARSDIADALLTEGEAVAHESARIDRGGSVTLWPPVRQEDLVLPEGRWPLDRDMVELRNAARIVAERIAGAIRRWIDEARPLAWRGRAVHAGDILILVQSRGALFHEIVRALKRNNLPSPGSDKLPVSTHIAVLDLLALADILFNPADDLNLATVLRSPLFDVSEEKLYDLAAGRGRDVSLWQRLRTSEIPEAREACERLRRWRARLDFDRPYEFFARVLYAERGLKRFHARLGEEVDDVLAEFLDLALAHEHEAQPSLQGFVAAMRQSDIAIKRDLNETGGVRVMTVHGAKGLEAPIVILADAATAPNAQKLGKPVYLVPDAPGPLLIHAASQRDHVAATLPFRERDADNQRAEYWRKLYVGMTRAEDELYVTGLLTKTGKLEGTWYEAIETALAGASVQAPVPGEKGEKGLRFPVEVPAPAPLKKQDALLRPKPREAYAPSPLPPPEAVEIIRPSIAGHDEAIFETAAEAVRDAETARKQGIALHALLQHLSRIDSASRPQIAARALAVLLPDLPGRHDALVRKALSILGAPANAVLFGPDSRAEVPLLARGLRNGKKALIAGRIDRLVVTGTRVLVADFKSDAVPPETPEKAPPAYLTQLGLYVLVMKKLFPGRTVEAGIFWTANETLMSLPEKALLAASAGFTLS